MRRMAKEHVFPLMGTSIYDPRRPTVLARVKSQPSLQEVQTVHLGRTALWGVRLELRVQYESKIINGLLTLPVRRHEVEIMILE